MIDFDEQTGAPQLALDEEKDKAAAVKKVRFSAEDTCSHAVTPDPRFAEDILVGGGRYSADQRRAKELYYAE